MIKADSYHKDLRDNLESLIWPLIALALVAAGGGVATFFGLKGLLATSHGGEAVVVPIVGALIMSLALFGIWHWFIKTGTCMIGTNFKALAIVLALFFWLASIAGNSWFIASAIGGDTANAAFLGENLQKARSALDAAYANALGEVGLENDVRDTATTFDALTRLEVQGKGPSEMIGKGAVTITLRSYAEHLNELADHIRAERARVGTLNRRGLAILADLQRIVAGKTPEEQFGERLAELSAIVSELRQIGVADTIARQIGSGVPVLRSGTTDAQRDAITAVRTKIEELASSLKEAITELQHRELSIEPLLFEPVSRPYAALRYADQIAGAWCVGIAWDTKPFIIFLALLLYRCQERALRPNEAASLSDRRSNFHIVA